MHNYADAFFPQFESEISSLDVSNCYSPVTKLHYRHDAL